MFLGLERPVSLSLAQIIIVMVFGIVAAFEFDAVCDDADDLFFVDFF